ncbi:MAG TPA: hypothetical protein VHE54_09150 [Puia sp.]|nr:hypothetical protein [Puia sp.]
METRRNFIRKMTGGGALLAGLRPGTRTTALSEGTSEAAAIGGGASYRVDNPYEGVQWNSCRYVLSATHVHVENQEKLDKYYQHFGLRHFPISNYYPSAPTYPIGSIRLNQYAVEQDFPGVVDGKLESGPFRWNDIIEKGPKAWADELPADVKARLPFQLGEPIFKNVPGDIIVSPNAEHHSFTNAPLHACAPGSMYASGNFDVHDVFHTKEHGYAMGTGLNWEDAFRRMLDKLLFADGGGITINHPLWSGLTFEQVVRMLDFDNRVLGIEVYNDTCVTGYGDPYRGWAHQLWDQVLGTGRRCLGFFVPDHTIGRGKSMLLVPEFTEHECLRAYRKGAFFGVLDGSGLRFTHIGLTSDELRVSLNNRAAVRAITDKGITHLGSGPEVVFKIPMGADGTPQIRYVRVEANDDSSEQLFSQPIRFFV